MQVDKAALEGVAHVTEANEAFKIALREDSDWKISSSRCCQSCRLRACDYTARAEDYAIPNTAFARLR